MRFTLTREALGNTLRTMTREPYAPFGLTGKLIAPAITVWLSGALCLVTCLAVCAASATACEAATKSSCCEQTREEADRDAEPPASISAESVDRASGCCLMFGNRPTVEQPQRHESSVDTDEPAKFIAYLRSNRPDVERFASALPVRSRGDTYLRCCVFLI